MSTAILRCIAANLTRPTYPVSVISQSATKFFVNMAQKTAILLIADGSEELEAVAVADVLRRARVDVTVASITGNKCVKCSRNVMICADSQIQDAVKDKKYDVVILPGGLGGTEAFISSTEVKQLLQEQEKENRLIAAICAAPTALQAHGIAKGKQLTSYPAMKDKLVNDYKYLEEKVVVDGNLITSRGPGTAIDFGLAIVEKLLDKEAANNVAGPMLHKM